MNEGASMANVLSLRSSTFFLWLMVLTMIVGCTGRRITTAVEDQQFQPGRSAVASGGTATAAPPAMGRQAPGEPLPTAPPAQEVRVTEQAVAAAPPSRPALPPVQLAEELADIYFDFDQYAIRGEARSVLEANAGVLMSQSHRDILIEGHCDERGTSAYNLVLGERRAQAAKRYLQELGVAPSQIKIASYGKERPFCREHSEACWQSNRRAHFRLP
jgi:peptidoglycan-associated lipoprotein